LTAGNPGRTKAENAAAEIGGIAIFPPFGDKDAGTDWNDYAKAHGSKATAAVIESAIKQASRSYRLRRANVVCVEDVQAEPITWLWPGRIARGKLSLIAGDPGLGKSVLTTALASVVSRGSKWPDGTACEPGSVIFLSAEDDLADTIRPRLDAAGADCS